MDCKERLLKYIAIRTPSDESSETVPSTTCQFELAQHLHREAFYNGNHGGQSDDSVLPLCTYSCHSRI